MSVNISCPSCANQGELPDDLPPNTTLTCRACGVRFNSPAPVVTPPSLAVDPHGMGVWVGGPVAAAPVLSTPAVPPPPDITPENAAAHLEWVRAEVQRFDEYVNRQLTALQKMREQIVAFEGKSRSEAVMREQAAARDRAILDARARELEGRLAEQSASLDRQAKELQGELDRQVMVERENLARRAEALARAERSVERRLKELDEMEESIRGELDDTRRVVVTPAPQSGEKAVACG